MSYSKKILVSKRLKGPGFIANPSSVVYVFRNTLKGSIGVCLSGENIGPLNKSNMRDILNAPPDIFVRAKEIIIGGDIEFPIYLGGPNRTEGLYFLHGYPEFANVTKLDHVPEKVKNNKIKKDSVAAEGVYFGTPYTFGHLLESGHVAEEKMRFFTGQCKWHAGQLETEIQAGFWEVCEPEPCLFFNLKACQKLLEIEENKKNMFPFNFSVN